MDSILVVTPCGILLLPSHTLSLSLLCRISELEKQRAALEEQRTALEEQRAALEDKHQQAETQKAEVEEKLLKLKQVSVWNLLMRQLLYGVPRKLIVLANYLFCLFVCGGIRR